MAAQPPSRPAGAERWVDHVIHWRGDLDLSGGARVMSEVNRVLASATHRRIVVDLGGVTFVDAVGLGSLVSVRNRCDDAHLPLMLRSVPEQAVQLLAGYGLKEMFTFEGAPVESLPLPDAVPLPARADPLFDRFASLTRRLLNVPIAMITLVDRTAQVMPGAEGLPLLWQEQRTTPLADSVCQHVVATGTPLIVPDAQADELLANHPATNKLGIAAYVGMPLTNPHGRVVGSLCAIDARHREWTDDELQDIRVLAGMASAALQARLVRPDATTFEHGDVSRTLQRQCTTHLNAVALLISNAMATMEPVDADPLLAALNRTDLALLALQAMAPYEADEHR